MIIFRYDKTWEGLLTAVFDAYSRRQFPDLLLGTEEPGPMFADESHTLVTDPERAARVWAGLCRRAGRRVRNMLLHVWLSEEQEADALIVRCIKKIFDVRGSVAGDFSDPDMLTAHKTAMAVAREAQFVRMFARLQKTTAGSYFAPVAPKYNALPLAVEYFRDRFADQRWLVYDTRRRYGYYYDLETVTEVTLDDDSHLIEGALGEDIIAADERAFQQAWRGYHKALSIKERTNPRLQRQHMPYRFWKYLTEMK